jgi:hypothetical protein
VVERGLRFLFDNRFLPGKLRITDDWREGRRLDPRQGSSFNGSKRWSSRSRAGPSFIDPIADEQLIMIIPDYFQADLIFETLTRK